MRSSPLRVEILLDRVQGTEEETLRRRKELQTNTEEINKSLGNTEMNKRSVNSIHIYRLWGTKERV
jgi:hypothetical protein